MTILPAQGLSGSGEVFYPVTASAFHSPTNLDVTSISLANYSKATLSFWFNNSHSADLINLFLALHNGGNQNAGVVLTLNGSSNIYFSVGTASNTTYYTFTSSISLAPYLNGKWHNWIFSWDYSVPSCQLYVDGQSITLTQTSHAVASTLAINEITIQGDSSGQIGSLSEFWLLSNVALDLSQLANIRKFFTASKRPAFLGTNGSLPTSTQAEVYLKGSGTGFNINSGSIGNFTTTGTLTIPTTTPSAP